MIDLNESALESAGVSRFGETNLYLSYQEPADGGGLVSEAGNAVHNLDQYNIWYNPSSSDVDSLNDWSFNQDQNAIELYFDESVDNVGDPSLYSVYGEGGTQIANAVNSVGFNSDWGDNTIFITLNLDALETAGVNSQEQLYVEYSGPDVGSGLEGLTLNNGTIVESFTKEVWFNGNIGDESMLDYIDSYGDADLTLRFYGDSLDTSIDPVGLMSAFSIYAPDSNEDWMAGDLIDNEIESILFSEDG